jgi:hypothetical protein
MVSPATILMMTSTQGNKYHLFLEGGKRKASQLHRRVAVLETEAAATPPPLHLRDAVLEAEGEAEATTKQPQMPAAEEAEAAATPPPLHLRGAVLEAEGEAEATTKKPPPHSSNTRLPTRK